LGKKEKAEAEIAVRRNCFLSELRFIRYKDFKINIVLADPCGRVLVESQISEHLDRALRQALQKYSPRNDAEKKRINLKTCNK